MTKIDIDNIKELSRAAVKAGLFQDLEQATAMHQSIQAIELFYHQNANNGNKEKSNGNENKVSEKGK